ncbi:uncharacterized protein LOC114280475 [Camellia sinensis]|uniref:uncharacterized protein LOC114280475 n=1 Tax=Camellia sinensis TaxID=4442 RepID=UPI001035821B|nr:uncharacterized protein LOC114280475 [Camellia sinensis]
MVLPQPPKDFRKSFYPSKDFKRLLGLPVDQQKAPLLLNYIPTYKSVLPDVPRKSKSPPSAITPQAESSRPDQGSTSGPVEQPSTSALQLIPPSQRQRQRQRRTPLYTPAGRTRSRRHRSAEASSYDPANPPTALPAIYFGTKVTVVVSADEMGHKKAVADDFLPDIPNTITIQSSPSQSQPKPKPKRLKKAQAKATVTQIDSEDTLPISKMAKAEKSTFVAEKRPAKAALSESTRSKKLRSESATTSGSLKSDALWAPPITIEDKPVRVSDSVTDLEVDIALSTALPLPKDLERNAEVSEYENFALMLQHPVQAIQHAHSFAMQAFDIKKKLTHKTKETAGLLRTINKAEAKMKTLIDQAKEAKQVQDEVDERADVAKAVTKVLKAEKKEAKAKTAEAQAELIAALATKDAEIKAADEKAYAERAVDVREDYKKQVKQACNKGFTRGWMAALKELVVPKDSTLRDNSLLILPFPPTPSQSEDEAESEEDVETDKSEKADAAKAKSPSPTLNEQFLDLTQGEGGEVSKEDASYGKTISEAPIAEKSLYQTLEEIDAELAAEKAAEKSSQMSSDNQTLPADDAE